MLTTATANLNKSVLFTLWAGKSAHACLYDAMCPPTSFLCTQLLCWSHASCPGYVHVDLASKCRVGDDDVTVTSCDIYSSVFCLFMKDDALIKLIIFCAVN